MRQIFKRLFHYWKIFARKLGRLQSLIILFVIYFVGVGTTSFFCKLLRKDLLNKRLTNKATFWIDREKANLDLESFKRQF